MCRFELCWDAEHSELFASRQITSNIRPEIGKIRPVIIVHAHKRCKLAIIVPLTSQAPTKEVQHTIHIPAKILPGVLSGKDSWALCDMICTVSLDRLEAVYTGNKRKQRRLLDANDWKLPAEYFDKIRQILKNMF